MEDKVKQLLIIDSNSVIHRAFHALPPLNTSKGELVNALYGFLLVFLKATKDFNPDFVAATFDLPAPTFRHKKFKQYKAKRPKAPDELYQQIPKVKDVLGVFKVPTFELEGFEADDLIGTIANLAPRKQVIPPLETIILSGDLDSLQLVNEKTKVYFLRQGVKDVVLYDEEQVKERYQGLKASQILDYKALRGDASDNIPGVSGIGEKTAIKLLLEFGSLDNIYKEKHLADKVSPRIADLLIKYKEQAFFSKELAKIDRNVPIDFNLKECAFNKYDLSEVINTLEDYNFYSLVKRIKQEEKDKDKVIGENLKLW